jgi:hypothetical protein
MLQYPFATTQITIVFYPVATALGLFATMLGIVLSRVRSLMTVATGLAHFEAACLLPQEFAAKSGR